MHVPFSVLRAAFVAVVASACSTAAPCDARTVASVAFAPPAPLPEGPSSAPTPGMVKVGGYWHWGQKHYEWVPSHWVTPPPGQRWAPPVLTEEEHGFTYENGGFTCEGDRP